MRCVPVLALAFAGAAAAPWRFTSTEAYCSYHCSPYTLSPATDCASRCSTTSRLLKEGSGPVAPIDFITCQRANLSVALTLGDDGLSFASFLDDFQTAVDAMVSGENPVLGACHLASLAPTNASTDPTSLVPTLVQIERCATEVACMPQIKAVLDGADPFLRLLSRSNGNDSGSTLVLVHANASTADALNRLNCTHRILPLPPLMKLTPFARSVSSVLSEAPAMEIGFIGPVSNETITELNAGLRQLTGISDDLLTKHSPKSLYVPSLSNFKVWSTVVTYLSRQDAVVFVTAFASTRHFSEPMPPLLRRLDSQADIVVGVTEAQNYGISGNDITVGITDTGLYMDHDQFDQPGARPFGRIVSTNRKVVSYEAFGDQFDQSENITCGHGTHVSGILLGSSLSKAQPNLGVAFNAKVAFMDIGTQSSRCANLPNVNCPVSLQTPSDVSDLLRNQVRAGAKIFSFSWGTDGDDYSQQARDLDDYIFSNPETLIVIAAGNSGDEGPRSISSPAGAKNVLSVGASMNTVASLASTLNCPNIFNPNSVASFSSIGPTSDGRMKPDLVAPGQVITSSQSLAAGLTTKTTQVCPLQGTSQATPVAAGVAVLIYEWLRDGWWKAGTRDVSNGLKTIPASLIKALMIHSATGLKNRIGPLRGLVTCSFVQQTATSLSYPDFNQGYGLPQLSNIASFGPSAVPKVFFLPNSTTSAPTLRHGGLHTYSFTVLPGQSLRVTLVWTDPPGSMAATTQLQNNLDLSVVLGTTIFYPIASPNGPDTVNNVEVVDVSYAALAKVASSSTSGGIVVEARIAGTSVLVTNTQAYSLVASSSAVASSTPSGTAPTSGATSPNGDNQPSSSSSSSSGFEWKTWMTIAVAVVGVVIVGLLGALLRRRKAPASGFVQTVTPRQMARYPAVVAAPVHVQPERCPFCPFVTPDPAVLVSHVQHLHPEV
ncbi:hypothetical protein SDRG_13366 [Saprolegnia diclina VS20]|uniref:subtilisin n=1 Tax=Saprolegnia diclina (strain VS20) TaxID=1156394 RepID=T0PTM4_SAPDV|nr:hypothetical protein SDRG_13366 [Saprolegnia diclina VS20]EQC28854.1 hypothetical protein SDRG_13366 [Saprolegnia diclina VS20]|eukprot:XP_008617671.1 hypothetical protein SDRG_13366 [Saprolegnia diclina VS20]